MPHTLTPSSTPAAAPPAHHLSVPRTPGARASRLLTDSVTMARRGAAHWRREPGQYLVRLAFPVMMLIMFAYFLGGGMVVSDGGDYREFLVPGMFALTMAFGMESTMVTLTQEIDRGLLDRFRSMPIAPSAVLIGRSLTDMAVSAVMLALMLGSGFLVGWRWHGSLAEGLAAIGLLLLLRFALLWVGIYLALAAGKPEMVQTVQILVWPAVFLSSAFTSPDTMPGWIGAIAEWNPMSATAGAVRELFGNPAWGGDSWAARHTGLMAVVWPFVLLVVFMPLAARRFAALSR